MVADIAKLTVGREEYYTRELATDHNSICPATASPQADGTALAPPRSPGVIPRGSSIPLAPRSTRLAAPSATASTSDSATTPGHGRPGS
jgi:hypothetical protein